MGRIFRELPPKGTDVAIAFSGGLDTRAAVAWLTKRGIRVHAYTADLGQPDEKDVSAIPKEALRHGAVGAQVIDAKDALCKEGLAAIQCRAFHLESGGKRYFNTTPLGRAVTATAIVNQMAKDGVNVFGDGSTHKGNDIQRFFRYGILVKPNLRIYKPWLDAQFVGELGGRAEMSAFLESIGMPYGMAAEKAYSTDSNMLGATHEAKDLERLDRGIVDVIQPIMGVAAWKDDVKVEKERVRIKFEAGVPVSINEKALDLVALFFEANTIGGRHALGMSDQIENRVIEAKSRGIYEAPGMALLSIAYERLVAAIHQEGTTDQLHSIGRRLGRLLYEGRWYEPEARMLQNALISSVASKVGGEVELELRRGDDWSIVKTAPSIHTYAPDKLSMERSETVFTPEDRIGALEMQTLGILDARELLA